MADELDTDVLRLTVKIVSALISYNQVEAVGLPELIQSVYRSLATAGTAKPEPALGPLTPAVPIRNSVLPDYIVCLEDGKKLKTLKRHLHTSHGMTPAQYRQRWGLLPGYPMVAPSYGSHRALLAKQVRFGRKPASPQQVEPPETNEVPDHAAHPPVTHVPARRARGSRG